MSNAFPMADQDPLDPNYKPADDTAEIPTIEVHIPVDTKLNADRGEGTLRTYRPYATVTAFRVVNALFDDPHPNPNHVAHPRVQYDPSDRTVWILQRSGRVTGCSLGDWVVFGLADSIMRFEDAEFRNTYEKQYEPDEFYGEMMERRRIDEFAEMMERRRREQSIAEQQYDADGILIDKQQERT